ncbi:MAG: ABC transporter ATP-binding protein [Truepera sp.]|nr:ABC transporter ATP-binding protein [Truepera sp.]
MNIVEMEQVTKRYGPTLALAEVSLSVAPGEIISVLGPNGAGKTTAIAIMLGLRQPSSGRATLFGQPPQSRCARARVGVMLQESGVPGSLTVSELISLFQSYYPHTLPLAEVLARADLSSKRHALISNLSGGQKQRLYFALALAGDPDLLFLDEPTVAMDVELRRTFWAQVQEFAALGKTILFSTHYLNEADAIATRIVVINRGRIIAEGTPRTIKSLVAEKTVRLNTDAPLERLQGYPSVQRAEQRNSHLFIYTNEPEACLAQLFREGWRVSELTVAETDLEAAFMSLTGQEVQA